MDCCIIVCVIDESLLVELMPVMYHMTEHSSAGANQLPRLLVVVVNILSTRSPSDPVMDIVQLATVCCIVSGSIRFDQLLIP